MNSARIHKARVRGAVDLLLTRIGICVAVSTPKTAKNTLATLLRWVGEVY